MATPSDSAVGADDALVRSGVRRAGRRLIPLLILLYFVNYLDRVNIAFAGPNGMNEELGLYATAFGVAAGVFFIGYLLLEVPSNLMLHRFGAVLSTQIIQHADGYETLYAHLSQAYVANGQWVSAGEIIGEPRHVGLGFSSVWITSFGSAQIMRIDPATNEVTATIEGGFGPEGIAFTDEFAWVANGREGTVAVTSRNA